MVILHSSVFFKDASFRTGELDEKTARKELKTNPKTKNICEVTPDYGLFRKTDVLGIRLSVGKKAGKELFIALDSPHFTELVEFADPIAYMAYERDAPNVPPNKRMVVLVKDGSHPAAVVDHKGGKTYNSKSERIKVLAQAKRFGANAAFMLTEKAIKDMPMPIVTGGPVAVEMVKAYENGTIWRLLDQRQ